MDHSPDSPAPRPEVGEVTALLLAWRADDPAVADRLLKIVQDELHNQAARAMRREDAAHTLQATALVNEAYLRLIDQRRVEWRNRAHFFGVAAKAMRRVLVDHARARHAEKRGGGVRALSLAEVEASVAQGWNAETDDVLALHEALRRLAKLDPVQARLVELRYFAGLNIDETAVALGVSSSTVKREWTIARGWLKRELDVLRDA